MKYLILMLLATTMPVSAAVRIAQIDPAPLLLNQQVHAWISVTRNGFPVKGLKKRDFSLSETASGTRTNYSPVKITGFRTGTNFEEGITIMLLIDNSGSMYHTLNGGLAAVAASRRISIASRVTGSFLKSVTNPKDRVGLAVFNTRYHEIISPTKDKAALLKKIRKIARPAWKNSYTELYASLRTAAERLGRTGGRKAIIVLSDGRNDPYKLSEGKPNPQFGDKIFTPREALKSCMKYGVSVFAINFGAGRMHDRYLGKIATGSGGTIFEARNGRALGGMYSKIIDLIINEYRITYRATMAPADLKKLRVIFRNREKQTGLYFSSAVFGLPRGITPLLLLPLLLAPVLLWLLFKKEKDNTPDKALLDILDRNKTVAFEGVTPGKTVALDNSGKTVISLSSGKTVISKNSPITPEDNATIVFDEKKKNYTINATRAIRINNNPVRTRVLQPGDVLRMDGRTYIFDTGKEK